MVKKNKTLKHKKKPKKILPKHDKQKPKPKLKTKIKKKPNINIKPNKKKDKKMKKKEKPNKKDNNMEDEMFDQLEEEEFDEIRDYFLTERELENLPHDSFTTYEIPKTFEENEEYLKKLIEESEVIIELLDARDVYYSLNKKIEEMINNKDHKLLIYVITKDDLVSENYIKKIFTRLTKEINNKIPIFSTSSLNREKICTLYQKILSQIKQFKSEMKTPKKKNEFAKVGVVGMPNVGKKSLIQSFELFVDSNCEDRYIHFDNNKLFCLNSVPAIIYENNDDKSYLISKKYKTIEDIPDPMPLICNLFNYIDNNKLKEIYGLTKKPENIQEFITLLKKKYSFKNELITEYQVLKDIISGKISYEANYL